MYKNHRKTYKFHGAAATWGVYGEPFFMIFLCGTCCGGFWGALRRFGAVKKSDSGLKEPFKTDIGAKKAVTPFPKS